MSEWPMVKLGGIAKFVSGGTPDRNNKAYYLGQIPWISGADISDSGHVQIRRRITEEAAEQSATSVVESGTLLLVTRTSIGKIALAPEDLAFSQDITGIFPNDAVILRKYLESFIRSIGAEQLKTRARGVTIKGVNRKDVEELKIPLPPLGEQKRIAEILGKTAGAISSVQKQIEQAKKLRSSIVGMASKMAVELRAISEYFDINPRQPRNIPDNAPTSFVPMANLDETFGISPIASRFSEHKKGYTYFENGDILLAKITPCFENGKSAIAKLSTQIGHGSTEFHVLRHKNHMHQDACLSPLLAAAILKQPSFLKPAENFMRGSAGQKRIPVSYIASLKVPVLKSVDLEKIDQSLEIVEALLNLYHRKLSLLQELQKSLANRAFAGLL